MPYLTMNRKCASYLCLFDHEEFALRIMDCASYVNGKKPFLFVLGQGFFLHGFSKTQAQKNSKIEEFLKTQAIFVQKLKG